MPKMVKANVFDISESEWDTKFKNNKEYDYRYNHDYCQYNMYGLDIIICMRCKSHSITDKIIFSSCAEKKMHDALK